MKMQYNLYLATNEAFSNLKKEIMRLNKHVMFKLKPGSKAI